MDSGFSIIFVTLICCIAWLIFKLKQIHRSIDFYAIKWNLIEDISNMNSLSEETEMRKRIDYIDNEYFKHNKYNINACVLYSYKDSVSELNHLLELRLKCLRCDESIKNLDKDTKEIYDSIKRIETLYNQESNKK